MNIPRLIAVCVAACAVSIPAQAQFSRRAMEVRGKALLAQVLTHRGQLKTTGRVHCNFERGAACETFFDKMAADMAQAQGSGPPSFGPCSSTSDRSCIAAMLAGPGACERVLSMHPQTAAGARIRMVEPSFGCMLTELLHRAAARLGAAPPTACALTETRRL